MRRAVARAFDEIERVVVLLSDMGVGDMRITGDEPLMRGVPARAGGFAAIASVHGLSAT